jgi:hypothetical protein
MNQQQKKRVNEMKTSESILAISPAIVAAQGAIKTVVKDAVNSFFEKADGSKTQYATLDSIIEAIKTPLLENGLSVIQAPTQTDGKTVVLTRILHTSGEYFEISTPLFLAKDNMQGFGSAITYAKRYALGSFFNIATETDDDANNASGNGKPAQQQPVNKAPAVNFSTYRMKLKTKSNDQGKILSEIGFDKLLIMLDYLDSESVRRKLSPDEIEFGNFANDYVSANSKSQPPKLNDNESIPF